MSLRFLAFLLSGLLLAGCVSQQDLQMQRDLLETKRRLSEAERSLKNLQDDTSGGVRAHVETLAKNQADFQAELDGLRVDLQSMQGRLGDQERTNDELRQEVTLLRDELSLQMADLDQRLGPASSTGQAPLTVAPQAPEAMKPAQPKPAPAVTPAAESAPELYDRALKTIREDQEYAKGRELMELFLKRYPEHNLAVNAAYWIGESYYAEKNYEQAILQFEKTIQEYGEHPKVASAMLKQALAFESTGDKATATLLLQRVIERFPLSDEAAKAKQALRGQ
ncbi:MAG: tol-pal system protein YbgF [Desulfuromonadales bacterium]